MDTAEPDGRYRSVEDGLPREVVEALAEHGHLDLLRREADDGDYECADMLGRLLRARGEPPAAALALLRPFVNTSWAARATDHIAEILAEEGDVVAAMAMLRPFADEGQREAVQRLGMLLVGQGRDEDLLAMLRQGLADNLYPIDVVVELTRGLGRDEAVIDLLRSRIDAGRRGLESLLASVLERDGRVEEAVTVLSASLRGRSYNIEDAEQLADLLARHDPAALVDFAAGDGRNGRKFATHRLARLCEEQGRIDDAVAVLAPLAARLRRKEEHGLVHYAVASWLGPVSADALGRNEAWLLADLLARHGRVEEAITVLRPAASADPALVRPLCLLLIGQGRPDEARAVVAEVVAEGRPDPVKLRLEWIEALVACGRHEQAIAELRTDPEAGSGYAHERLAALLACFGSPDEAIAMLGPATEGWDRVLLAKALIRAGRPQDAIATMRAEPTTEWV
ncbi:tetratricopeptide repeat protein [Dactylosporangium salmoneum]|uniref:HEAT repeat domain-containing protein n=1 Tax=Dactylosporangium salmoneum TaxID=53361 RepID=A0ABP5SY50_9ACTN